LEAIIEDSRGRTNTPLPGTRSGWGVVLVLPAALFLLVGFAWPVLQLLARGFTEPSLGLTNYWVVIGRPVFARTLWNTVVISATVDFFCFLIGYPVAYTMATAGPRLRRLLIFAVLIPFWTSVLVRSFAWIVLLQRNGVINHLLIALGLIPHPLQLVYNRIGVVIGMVQILLPFMIFPLYSSITQIDPAYSQAAATLGARPLCNLVRVLLPLTLPGVLAGCALVFVIALGYYIVPVLLGGLTDVMIAQLIQMEVAELGKWGVAGALSTMLVAATLLTLALIRGSYSRISVWRN
jgi:putative spermidine/putrescine transport system permease protein